MRDLGLALAVLSGASLCSTSVEQSLPLHIRDEFTHPGEAAPGIDKVADPAFRNFIAATVERLGGKPRIQPAPGPGGLTFVRIALASSGANVPALPPIARPLEGECMVTSPWIVASVDPETSAIVGTIYWSERQILRDQLVLAGNDPPPGQPTALPGTEFAAMARRYGQSVMHGTPAEAGSIPAEVLWLFKRAPQSTRGPFQEGAKVEMGEIAQAAADTYADLVAAIIAKCRQSPGQSLQLKTITDLRAIMDLEKLRAI